MDKAQFRRTVTRRVSAVEAAASRRVADQIFDWMVRRLPGTVAAYYPMDDEIDVTGLTNRLPGWRWVFPRVEADDSLSFRDRDVPLETHRLGMRQPVGAGTDVPVSEIDLFLVPGIAFDRKGRRLGRGGGYYDRILQGRRADSVAIGVTIEDRLVSSVPVEPHDHVMDLIVTGTGVISCNPTT